MTSAAASWIEHEFADVRLGDTRLDDRYRTVLVDLTRHCTKTVCRSLARSPARMKAAYRFFDNARVRIGDMLAPHVNRTAERVRDAGATTVLVVQDTTTLNYANRARTTGLDIVNTSTTGTASRGLLLHNTMAIGAEDGTSFGLLDQRFVDRKQVHADELLPARTDTLPIEDKESRRWIDVIRDVHAMDLGDSRIVHVADREADIYELFRDAAALGEHVLVRACDNRAIDKASRSEKAHCWLFDDLMGRRAQGTTTVNIQVNGRKKFRTAKLSIIHRRISLPAPQSKSEARDGPLPMIDLTAIMAIEKNPPNARDKLCWVLLTDLAVDTLEEAIEKVGWYSLRWRIEVFHKVLKSGCRIEAAQLGDAERLKRLVIAKSVVAWRLFWLRHLGEQERDASCEAVLETEEWQLLYRIEHRTTRAPKTAPTAAEALLWIAKLGGYLNRKSDPEPGVISLWRGWEQLSEMVDNYRAICGES